MHTRVVHTTTALWDVPRAYRPPTYALEIIIVKYRVEKFTGAFHTGTRMLALHI